jgi:hypothetical protein
MMLEEKIDEMMDNGRLDETMIWLEISPKIGVRELFCYASLDFGIDADSGLQHTIFFETCPARTFCLSTHSKSSCPKLPNNNVSSFFCLPKTLSNMLSMML